MHAKSEAKAEMAVTKIYNATYFLVCVKVIPNEFYPRNFSTRKAEQAKIIDYNVGQGQGGPGLKYLEKGFSHQSVQHFNISHI